MDDEARQDLIGRLFALMTAKLEDGAALAAEGQRRDMPDAVRAKLAEQIRDTAMEASLLAEVIAGLVAWQSRTI